jgi:hypothetical protein
MKKDIIEQDSLENILNSISRLKIPNVQPFEDRENQRKQMKQFNIEYVKFAYYNGKLKMIFATLNENLWAESLKKYVEEITKRKSIEAHMKVSGSEKTAKLFVIGTRMHLIYMTAMSQDRVQPDFPHTSYSNFFSAPFTLLFLLLLT